jgi:hypothetical protein
MGTFGQVFINGIWQTNFNKLTAEVEQTKKELLLSGDLWTRHKKGALKGTGTLSGFKVTSDMIAGGFNKLELLSTLSDPESYGYETIRIQNVLWDKLQLANWEAGTEIAESMPFTFSNYELLDPIIGPDSPPSSGITSF